MTQKTTGENQNSAYQAHCLYAAIQEDIENPWNFFRKEKMYRLSIFTNQLYSEKEIDVLKDSIRDSFQQYVQRIQEEAEVITSSSSMANDCTFTYEVYLSSCKVATLSLLNQSMTLHTRENLHFLQETQERIQTLLKELEESETELKNQENHYRKRWFIPGNKCSLDFVSAKQRALPLVGDLYHREKKKIDEIFLPYKENKETILMLEKELQQFLPAQEPVNVKSQKSWGIYSLPASHYFPFPHFSTEDEIIHLIKE